MVGGGRGGGAGGWSAQKLRTGINPASPLHMPATAQPQAALGHGQGEQDHHQGDAETRRRGFAQEGHAEHHRPQRHLIVDQALR